MVTKNLGDLRREKCLLVATEENTDVGAQREGLRLTLPCPTTPFHPGFSFSPMKLIGEEIHLPHLSALWVLLFRISATPFLQQLLDGPSVSQPQNHYVSHFTVSLRWSATTHSSLFFFGGGTPCGFWDLKSPTRGWIHLLAVEALSPNHWITREATSPNSFFIWETGPQRDKGIWSGSCFIRGMRASGFSSEPSLRPWGFVVTICHVKVLNGTCLIWKYVVTVFF